MTYALYNIPCVVVIVCILTMSELPHRHPRVIYIHIGTYLVLPILLLSIWALSTGFLIILIFRYL